MFGMKYIVTESDSASIPSSCVLYSVFCTLNALEIDISKPLLRVEYSIAGLTSELNRKYQAQIRDQSNSSLRSLKYPEVECNRA